MKLFIERDADIETKDNGRIPLSLAKTEEVTKMLIDAGADVNSKTTAAAYSCAGRRISRLSSSCLTPKPT
jgi:hypothetical protein